MIKLLLIFFISPLVFAGNVKSPTKDRGVVNGAPESEHNVRVFKKIAPDWKILSEFKFRNEEASHVKSLNIGTYYRVSKSWKLGLFYSRQSGLLHDADWVQKKKGGWWRWRDTTERTEQIYTFDATYRLEIMKNTVLEIKNRFNYNSYNDHQFLRVRPGVTYFLKKDALPFFNFYLQQETYHPLSGYSEESIYERWTYLGALYHINETYQLGAFVAKKEVHWESGLVKSDVSGLNLTINI